MSQRLRSGVKEPVYVPSVSRAMVISTRHLVGFISKAILLLSVTVHGCLRINVS